MPETPEAALERLLAGNARFVEGKLEAVDAILERRTAVAGGQSPFAIVLTCADSRVAPELVFDQALGDLFVCRIAGNLVDARIAGSIEYAITQFHSALVIVLGHQRCGAVTDTITLVEHGGSAPGSIQSVVEALAPVVRATPRDTLGDGDYVEKVIRANAKAVVQSLSQGSSIVANEVAEGKLRVAAAVYSLDSGRVTLLR